jgi:hypothetical protein
MTWNCYTISQLNSLVKMHQMHQDELLALLNAIEQTLHQNNLTFIVPSSLSVGSRPMDAIKRTIVEPMSVSTADCRCAVITMAADTNIIVQTRPDNRASSTGKESNIHNITSSEVLYSKLNCKFLICRSLLSMVSLCSRIRGDGIQLFMQFSTYLCDLNRGRVWHTPLYCRQKKWRRDWDVGLCQLAARIK